MQLEYVQNKVEQEVESYRKEVIEQYSKEELWEHCYQIFFYCSIEAYIEEQEELPLEVVEMLEQMEHPIAELWQLYLKEEGISFLSWGDIESMFQRIVERKKEKQKNECKTRIGEESSKYQYSNENNQKYEYGRFD